MVLDLEPRYPPGIGTLRMIQEEAEKQKYCYPFKEYDPRSNNTTTRNTSMTHKQVQNATRRSSQALYANISSVRGSRTDLYTKGSQNVPPPVPESEPPPLPPRRLSSLFGPGRDGVNANGSTTLTLLRLPKLRESSSLNPKRISIATSNFYPPDMPHFASGWELGHNNNSLRAQSVWGTTERGGRPVTESVDIWGDPPAVKKGVLLQQRDKLWSRWKERYFILTRDYLNCFRKTACVHKSGVRLSEMGSFIYKLRLADVEGIEWETRKSGCMIAIMLTQDPKILVRVPGANYEELHQWYTLLQECVYMSKERRRALRTQQGGSLLRSTASYNPAATKSTGSSSPHSSSTKSSKSASNSDLDRMGSGSSDGGKHNGLLSIRKAHGGSNNRLIDDEDDEDDDYDETVDSIVPPKNINLRTGSNININLGGTENADDEFKVTLRRRREINNNGGGIGLPTSWRLSIAHPPDSKTEMLRGNINSSMRLRNQNNNGYPPPNPRPRPESWAPQQPVFHRTSSLMPSQWLNRRDLQNGNYGYGSNGRSEFCPSRVTADVTFRRMS